MTNLEVYRRYVNEMKEYAAQNGISASETNKIFEQCFRKLDVKFSRKVLPIKKTFAIIKYLLTIAFSLFLLCTILFYHHQTTNKLVMRNIQNFIYPGLKILRKTAVPIIKRYPSLTELYDEWCLVENPYFRLTEMDCWPCSTVRSIPDLTGRNLSSSLNIGMPYTMEEAGGTAALDDLLATYEKNMDIFDNDASRISSNNASYRVIRDLFEKRLDEKPTAERDAHITWRINRMKPGRLIRKLFPRPATLPNTWSQSTEKFVFIDESRSPTYALPNPECSNIVLKCTSGSRLVNMLPSPECRQSCNSFTILLSAGHSCAKAKCAHEGCRKIIIQCSANEYSYIFYVPVWYNWWYWRPLSIPAVNSTDISISYLISFC